MYAMNETTDFINYIDDPEELVKRDGTKHVFMHHVRSSPLSGYNNPQN